MTLETKVNANLLWWDILADFLCECEGATTIDDCTMPSTVTCEKCGKKYSLKLVIEQVSA